MIRINGKEIKMNHFPDGSMMLLDVDINYEKTEAYFIEWFYKSDDELLMLMYLVNHIRQNVSVKRLCNRFLLLMPYIPNARMDRVKNRTEVFTLKYFCNILNSLHFDIVSVLDPHSNVSTALIDNISIEPLQEIFNELQNDVCFDTVYFPDESSKKRYESYFQEKNLIYGKKHRDWKSGQILGVETCGDIISKDYHNKDILIVDDIISKGGSIYYGLKNLIKDYGEPNSITIYASHVESSIIEGNLWKEFITNGKTKLYTTNSIDRTIDLNDYLENKNVEIKIKKFEYNE